MENELQVIDAPRSDLTIARSCETVLEEAKRAATALTTIIDSKKKKVQFRGKTYLEFEDWQTMGRFYGLSAKVESTSPIELGESVGFEARAVVINNNTGEVVSAADSMCMNDEENWNKRNGVPVPMFQLRSMAQTRACAKAFRNVLSWVVVMAGYAGTPAEEMESVIAAGEGSAPSAPPAEAKAAPEDGVVIGKVEKLDKKSGETNGKTWNRYSVFIDGVQYQTFSGSKAKLLKQAHDDDATVTIDFESITRGKWTNNDILDVAVMTAPPAEDDVDITTDIHKTKGPIVATDEEIPF